MKKFFKNLFKNKNELIHITSDMWYNDHKYCPKCFYSNFSTTRIPVIIRNPNDVNFFDGVNKVQCLKCQWKGYRYEMISFNEINNIQE